MSAAEQNQDHDGKQYNSWQWL